MRGLCNCRFRRRLASTGWSLGWCRAALARRVQIETMPVMRGTVYPVRSMGVRPRVEEAFGFAKVQLQDVADLYADIPVDKPPQGVARAWLRALPEGPGFHPTLTSAPSLLWKWRLLSSGPRAASAEMTISVPPSSSSSCRRERIALFR